MLILGKHPIVTERGTFQTLTLQDVVHLMDADEIEDIVEHDTASDALDWINMDVAYAVLNSGGFDAASQSFRGDMTTVSEFLLVNAVRVGTVVDGVA
jgi:hypothetical protein